MAVVPFEPEMSIRFGTVEDKDGVTSGVTIFIMSFRYVCDIYVRNRDPLEPLRCERLESSSVVRTGRRVLARN
jgi:hypothetical protein